MREVPYAIGEPGRLATEARPGIPLGPSLPADVELSEHEIDGLAIRAASVRGLLHRHRDEPRQDAFATAWNADTQTLLIVVADGVGSMTRSHETSALAVRLACARWDGGADELATLGGDVNAELLRGGPVEENSRPAGRTTLTLVAVRRTADDTEVSIAWVGDSPAFLLDGSEWLTLTRDEDADDETLVHPIRALPSTRATFRRASGRWARGVLFVTSDGVGNALASPEVRVQLADWWARPPALLTFGAQLDFARMSFVDDRTCVGVWLPAPDEA